MFLFNYSATFAGAMFAENDFAVLLMRTTQTGENASE